jgi:hypothetical protein
VDFVHDLVVARASRRAAAGVLGEVNTNTDNFVVRINPPRLPR